MKTQATEMLQVRGLHRSHSPRRDRWVEPVGWTPEVPDGFEGEEFVLDGGGVWGPHEEEAGIVCFGEVGEGEVVEVPLSDLAWVACGEYHLIGPVRPE